MYQYNILQDDRDKVQLSILTDTSEISIELSKFNSFPLEWKLTTSPSIGTLPQETIEFIIQLCSRQVESKGGQRVVRILEKAEIGTNEESKFRDCGFDTYFIERHSVLDLQDFKMESMKLDDISIHFWGDITTINHQSETYLDELRTLYNVEYEADYEIRSTGRWDMFEPDPTEFVKRFVTDEARDDFMFVAKRRDEIVGLTYPWIENATTAGIYFTGTIPKYTKRHIATALKIEMAKKLKEMGYLYLITTNRATNTAILHTNDNLKFKVTHDRLFLKLDLTNSLNSENNDD